MTYFNEIDTYPAEWLTRLYPEATVDIRSIADVQPDDLAGFTRAHFFAGIGGWEYALQLAGWPADEPVWTGSCPCQPFSIAGKGKGEADKRHLWPEFRRLIAERRPPVIFGEQVASRAGREWLAGVRADLEALGYAVGAADLCAAGVTAPHIRQRLFWVADRSHHGRRQEREIGQGSFGGSEAEGWAAGLGLCGASSGVGGVADSNGGQPCDRGIQRGGEHGQQPQDGGTGGLGDAAINEHAQHQSQKVHREETAGSSRLSRCDGTSGASGASGVGHPDITRSQGRCERSQQYADLQSAWTPSILISCLDGKARRVEPSIQPLAHGVPARVGRLRAYGNAIVPQVAATFIRAYREARGLA